MGRCAMSETREQLSYWRKKEADLRLLANRSAVPSISDLLRKTALYYQRLADDLEQRLRDAPDRQKAG
jgi:hypothetical protein